MINLREFRTKYPLREPKVSRRIASQFTRIPDEQMNASLEFGPPPVDDFIAEAPDNADTAARGRYLWVISADGSPYVLETCPFAEHVDGALIKHTNLTGGEPAHCGGEIWFLNEAAVVMNGSSGRYGPRSLQELKDAGLAVKACGFAVQIMGFLKSGIPMEIVTGEEDLICL